MARIASQYFQSLYSEGVGEYDQVLQAIKTRITTAENDALLKPLKFEEFSVPSSKCIRTSRLV